MIHLIISQYANRNLKLGTFCGYQNWVPSLWLFWWSFCFEWADWFLLSVQSGCCKPSNDCGFTYEAPTQWTNNGTTSTNPDCTAWSNDQSVLCYNCQSCKAGLLDQLKTDWKKVAIINIVFLIVLIVVYSIGCCAFRNNRRDNAYGKYPWGGRSYWKDDWLGFLLLLVTLFYVVINLFWLLYSFYVDYFCLLLEHIGFL